MRTYVDANAGLSSRSAGEFRLGVFDDVPLEQVQPVRAVAAQLAGHAAGVNGPVVRLEKLRIDLERRAHAERRQHQVARRQALVGAKVAADIPAPPA